MPTAKHASSTRKTPAKRTTAKQPITKQALTRRKTAAVLGAAQKLSAADRSKAEALLAEIARRKQRIAEDFYDIGLALAQLSKKKLYVALGHASFDDLLQQRNVMNASTARGLIRLVGSMTRDEALTYGQEKAIALSGYAKATPEVDTPKTLMETGRLPGGKSVAQASVREIKQGARAVRAAQGKAAPISAEAKAAQGEATSLHKWLVAHGASKAIVSAGRTTDGYVIRIEMPVAASVRLRSR